MFTGPVTKVDIFGLPKPNGIGIGYGLGGNDQILSTFVGNWLNGLMDGFGEITYTNRPVYYYRGGWKNGLNFGDGERRDDDGTVTTLTHVE